MSTIRTDPTAVETNIHWPTDSAMELWRWLSRRGTLLVRKRRIAATIDRPCFFGYNQLWLGGAGPSVLKALLSAKTPFCAHIAALDECLGRVTQMLAECAREDDTIIFLHRSSE